MPGGRSLGGLPPPPDWHDWAQRQLSRLSSVSAFPLSLSEVGTSAAAGRIYASQTRLCTIKPCAELHRTCPSSPVVHALPCLSQAAPCITAAPGPHSPPVPLPLQAVQLEGPPFQAYLQYLQQGLFASFQPPPNLETVHQLFQRLALPQQQHVHGDAIGGGGSSSGGGLGVHGLPACGGRGGQGQPALAAPTGQQGEHEGGQQGEQRPVQSAYRFSGAVAQHKGMAHADYALLLAACAAPVWLVPEALHEVRQLLYLGGRVAAHAGLCWLCRQEVRDSSIAPWACGAGNASLHGMAAWLPKTGTLTTRLAPCLPPCLLPARLQLVAGLERGLIAAECEVSFQYNSREQARLARMREEGAWQRWVVGRAGWQWLQGPSRSGCLWQQQPAILLLAPPYAGAVCVFSTCCRQQEAEERQQERGRGRGQALRQKGRGQQQRGRSEVPAA